MMMVGLGISGVDRGGWEVMSACYALAADAVVAVVDDAIRYRRERSDRGRRKLWNLLISSSPSSSSSSSS